MPGRISRMVAGVITRSDADHRDVERERHPRPAGAVRRVGRARSPRRDLPAGDQGGAGGYSGVALHLRKERFPSLAGAPPFAHPAFDRETRVVEATVGDLVIASVYVPNGGKDYPAKLAFLADLEGYVADVHRRGARLVLCGDLNVARTDRDVHAKER